MTSTKGEYLSPYKEVGLSAKAARLGQRVKKRYHQWRNLVIFGDNALCARCDKKRWRVGKKPCKGR